ncbi:Uma2 family endonuclease [Actinoplanes sp. CA-131856]
MTAESRLTVDDVADFPEELRFELLDGKVFRRPSPVPFHQCQCVAVIEALRRGAPRDRLPVYGMAVEIDRYNMPFVDVVVMRAAAALRAPVPARDVLVAVELTWSWSDAIDRGPKKRLYARAGIPAYWLVDLLAEQISITQFVLGRDGRYRRRLHSTEQVTIEQPWPTVIDLPAMTREREELRAIAEPNY